MPSIQRTQQGGHVTRRSSAARSGLNFDVARNVDDVLRAWELVYTSYHRTGLIDPNVHRVHLVPHAVHPDSAVIVGRIQTLVVSTMTIMGDRSGGLPLDDTYPAQMQALRQNGRRLVEVGLFADRREHIARSITALLELMRHVFYYSMYSGATDIVLGVHPHHAGFYERCLACEPFAPVGQCPSVNDHPVVPLRLPIRENLAIEPSPKGLAFFKNEPLGPQAFQGRMALARPLFQDTAVDRYLRQREKVERRLSA